MYEFKVDSAKLIIKLGDITDEETDAIVNSASASLMGGGGVDGVIHQKGGPAILSECIEIRKTLPEGLPAGEAVITNSGKLKTKKVIHTVGPVWRGGDKQEPALLRKAYFNSLLVAKKNGIRTISFPSLSTGAFGYPVKFAAKIAVKSIIDFIRLEDSLDCVVIVIFHENDLIEYVNAVKEFLKD